MSLKLSRRGITLITVIIVASLIVSISGVYALNAPTGSTKGELAKDLRKAITVEEVVVTSINNSTITILEESGAEMKLLAKGIWVVIADRAERLPWIEAMNLVREGKAKAIILTRNAENGTKGILLGLKQDETVFFRPILAKTCARGHRRASIYLSFRGEVEKIGENYMILKRRNQIILALTRGNWTKAGDGEVGWRDVSSEFNQEDEVRLFYHNLVVMNNLFAENLGIRGFIWGYSGAIIDLTSGTTLSRK